MTTRTVSELADLCGATLEGDGSHRVVGPATLLEAGPDEVSFLAHPRYRTQLAVTRAVAVLVEREEPRVRDDLALLRCEDPNRAFTEIVRAFAGEEHAPAVGVHPDASVAASARVESTARIGAGVVVDEGAEVEAGAVMHPGAVLGAGAKLGARSVLYSGVVIYSRVELGEDCVIHGGTVIGSDGFGFDPTAEGWVKIPQCGSVVLGDAVEIGSNSTIDRGRFGVTRIGNGVKIDNQVHVGHNVVIGDGCLLVAQVGIAGSASLGKGVVLAGKAGVNGHVHVGDGVRAAGLSMIYGDVEAGKTVYGNPARERSVELRAQVEARRLPRKLAALEERLRALEEGSAAADEDEA